MATWMVPTGMTNHVHAFDAREGGSFRISPTYDAPTGTGKTPAHTGVLAVHDGLPPGLSTADNEAGWPPSLAKRAALVEARGVGGTLGTDVLRRMG